VNDRLIAEIRANGPTIETALQLFAVEVEPLPGVEVPPGDVTPVTSGTYAYNLALRYYSEMTPEQQSAFSDLMVQGANPGDPSPFATRPELPLAAATSGSALALRTSTLRRSPTTSQLDAYFLPLYEWAGHAIAAKTGRPEISAFQLVYGPIADPLTWAFSTTWDPQEERYISVIDQAEFHACHSHIDVAKFANQAVSSQLSVVTHEVFHCYQQDASVSAEDVGNTPLWLIDGEATWAQMVLVPGADFTALHTHWSEYISQPKQGLYTRRYDAAGFFGHVADVAGEGFVWSTVIEAYVAGGQAGDDAGFTAATAGVEDKVLDTWAASYFRGHDGKFLWDMKGPGTVNMPTESPTPTDVTVPSGSTVALTSVSSWQLGLSTLRPMADVLTIVMPTGHGAVIDTNGQLNKVLTPGEPLTVCVVKSCVCPPDQEGTVPPTVSASSPLDVGLTGGRNGAAVYASASSLSDFCSRKPLPPPPPGGGGGGGGSPGGGDGGVPPSAGPPPNGKSLSDPHLVTFDGRRYDLQAVGEFVLAKSTTDDFEVQARFESRASRTWSTATMMATTVGNQRITVSVDILAAQAIPKLQIDGVLTTEPFVMLDGGSVRSVATTFGDSYVVEFADGSRVGTQATARGGLTIWVAPADARKGSMTGLLGDDDGTVTNDPTTRDTTTVLPEPPAYDDLYGAFAASWRITADESLFDYRVGETTATITDLTFPDRDTPVAAPEVIDAATTSCTDAGVTDAALLSECAFDIAATGDATFALVYAPEQTRADTWAGLTGDGTVDSPTGTGRTESVTFDGNVAAPTDAVSETFPGFEDDIIYIDPPDCVAPRFMTINAPDGEQVAGPVACGDRVVLPADGTYTIDMNPFLDSPGRYHVPLVSVRPDLVRDLQPGDAMDGTISQRAEHDLWRVTARAGDTLATGGADCTAEFDVTVIYGNDEMVTGGGGCGLGTITFPKAGTYQFVINAFNGAIGDYHIPTGG
jgi:hypothetical protein